MKKDLQCPICEEGNLSERVGKNRVDYKGSVTELDSHFSVCDSCGSEQANAQQVRMNKRYMVAFKKQVDGLLTGSEVKSVREKLGLTQLDAAKIFGGGPVAFSKYEADDVTQSEAMDKLLCVAVEVPGAFDYLVKRARLHVDVNRIRYVADQAGSRLLSSWHSLCSGEVSVAIHEYVDSPVDWSEMLPGRTSPGTVEPILLKRVSSSARYKRLQ